MLLRLPLYPPLILLPSNIAYYCILLTVRFLPTLLTVPMMVSLPSGGSLHLHGLQPSQVPVRHQHFPGGSRPEVQVHGTASLTAITARLLVPHYLHPVHHYLHPVLLLLSTNDYFILLILLLLHPPPSPPLLLLLSSSSSSSSPPLLLLLLSSLFFFSPPPLLLLYSQAFKASIAIKLNALSKGTVAAVSDIMLSLLSLILRLSLLYPC